MHCPIYKLLVKMWENRTPHDIVLIDVEDISLEECPQVAFMGEEGKECLRPMNADELRYYQYRKNK